MDKILFSEHFSYVLLTSLIRPHNMVNSIIPLTAQKYHVEIHLQAA